MEESAEVLVSALVVDMVVAPCFATAEESKQKQIAQSPWTRVDEVVEGMYRFPLDYCLCHHWFDHCFQSQISPKVKSIVDPLDNLRPASRANMS